MRFDLSDEDWALLEPLLPKSRKSAVVVANDPIPSVSKKLVPNPMSSWGTVGRVVPVWEAARTADLQRMARRQPPATSAPRRIATSVTVDAIVRPLPAAARRRRDRA